MNQAFLQGQSHSEHFDDFLQCLHRMFWSRFWTSIRSVSRVSHLLHLLHVNMTTFGSSFWCIVSRTSHLGVSYEGTLIAFKSSSHCVLPRNLKILGIKEHSPFLIFCNLFSVQGWWSLCNASSMASFSSSDTPTAKFRQATLSWIPMPSRSSLIWLPGFIMFVLVDMIFLVTFLMSILNRLNCLSSVGLWWGASGFGIGFEYPRIRYKIYSSYHEMFRFCPSVCICRSWRKLWIAMALLVAFW